MSKRKKHILTFDDEPEFELIGICTHHSDYRLAWSMNEALGFHLAKCDDYPVEDKKGQPQSEHSMYSFEDEEDRVLYYMIKNKSQGKLLIAECPSIDYFLFLCNNYAVDTEDLVKRIKEVPSVVAAFVFDPEELPSTELIQFN